MVDVLIAGIVAMVISIAAGPRFIRFLRLREYGQPIREEGPAGHFVKQGTPTMGGLLILSTALVAYLALEGTTPRAKLVGLLWPEASEHAARANLRQLLRRLRVTAGADVVVGNTGLQLAADVWVDARSVPAPAADEELLEGCDYDDYEELSAWVGELLASYKRPRRLVVVDQVHVVIGPHRRRASARSSGVVTVRLAGSPLTTATLPPVASTSDAQSVAVANTSAGCACARRSTSARKP